MQTSERRKPGPKPLARPSRRVAVRLTAEELDQLATISECPSTAIHEALRRLKAQDDTPPPMPF